MKYITILLLLASCTAPIANEQCTALDSGDAMCPIANAIVCDDSDTCYVCHVDTVGDTQQLSRAGNVSIITCAIASDGCAKWTGFIWQ